MNRKYKHVVKHRVPLGTALNFYPIIPLHTLIVVLFLFFPPPATSSQFLARLFFVLSILYLLIPFFSLKEFSSLHLIILDFPQELTFTFPSPFHRLRPSPIHFDLDLS